MIIWIDDELWSVQALVEWVNNLDGNCCKHFVSPIMALDTIKERIDSIDIIIIDLSMFYGEFELHREEFGGIQLLKELRAKFILDDIRGSYGRIDYLKGFDFIEGMQEIPILIYSVVDEFIINQEIPDYRKLPNIDYLNKNEKIKLFKEKVINKLNDYQKTSRRSKAWRMDEYWK